MKLRISYNIETAPARGLQTEAANLGGFFRLGWKDEPEVLIRRGGKPLVPSSGGQQDQVAMRMVLQGDLQAAVMRP
jgi:hypothetical protein